MEHVPQLLGRQGGGGAACGHAYMCAVACTRGHAHFPRPSCPSCPMPHTSRKRAAHRRRGRAHLDGILVPGLLLCREVGGAKGALPQDNAWLVVLPAVRVAVGGEDPLARGLLCLVGVGLRHRGGGFVSHAFTRMCTSLPSLQGMCGACPSSGWGLRAVHAAGCAELGTMGVGIPRRLCPCKRACLRGGCGIRGFRCGIRWHVTACEKPTAKQWLGQAAPRSSAPSPPPCTHTICLVGGL